MNKPKGGRGQRAPYESIHVRIPGNIKELVQNLADQFRTYLLKSDRQSFDEKNLLPTVPAIYILLDEAGNIVHVGRTDSLVQRWSGQGLVPPALSLPNPTVAWIQCGDPAALSAIMQRLAPGETEDLASFLIEWEGKRTDSPRWYFAKKLLAELRALLNPA